MLDRKYERQMSGKEKRKFEAEKMRQMTLKEKIEYLWMYYKIIFLIPVIIGVVIYLGVTMYQGCQRSPWYREQQRDGGDQFQLKRIGR